MSADSRLTLSADAHPWASALVYCLAATAFVFGAQSAFPQTFEVQARLGMTSPDHIKYVGLILTTAAFTAIATLIIAGIACDRMGYVIILVVSLSLQSLCVLSVDFAASIAQLFTIAIFFGVTHSLTTIGCLGLAIGSVPRPFIGLAIGFMFALDAAFFSIFPSSQAWTLFLTLLWPSYTFLFNSAYFGMLLAAAIFLAAKFLELNGLSSRQWATQERSGVWRKLFKETPFLPSIIYCFLIGALVAGSTGLLIGAHHFLDHLSKSQIDIIPIRITIPLRWLSDTATKFSYDGVLNIERTLAAAGALVGGILASFVKPTKTIHLGLLSFFTLLCAVFFFLAQTFLTAVALIYALHWMSICLSIWLTACIVRMSPSYAQLTYTAIFLTLFKLAGILMPFFLAMQQAGPFVMAFIALAAIWPLVSIKPSSRLSTGN